MGLSGANFSSECRKLKLREFDGSIKMMVLLNPVIPCVTSRHLASLLSHLYLREWIGDDKLTKIKFHVTQSKLIDLVAVGTVCQSYRFVPV